MRWPNPMIFSLRSSRSRMPCSASSGSRVCLDELHCLLVGAAVQGSGQGADGARRRRNDTSDRVLMMTRAANVEALNSCSA